MEVINSKKQLAHILMNKWESHNKNTINPVAEFETILLSEMKKLGLYFVPERQFEINLLNKYMETHLDNYVESGDSVKEWFLKETFILGEEPLYHYEMFVNLAIE